MRNVFIYSLSTFMFFLMLNTAQAVPVDENGIPLGGGNNTPVGNSIVGGRSGQSGISAPNQETARRYRNSQVGRYSNEQRKAYLQWRVNGRVGPNPLSMAASSQSRSSVSSQSRSDRAKARKLKSVERMLAYYKKKFDEYTKKLEALQ